MKISILKNAATASLTLSLLAGFIQPAYSHNHDIENSSPLEYIRTLQSEEIITDQQALEAERFLLLQSSTLAPLSHTSPQALPVALPIVLTCIGTVGLSTYQAYKGGDPVEYIATAIIGCIPFGSAARPAVIGIIRQFRPEIVRALKVLGATTLATALDRTPAY